MKELIKIMNYEHVIEQIDNSKTEELAKNLKEHVDINEIHFISPKKIEYLSYKNILREIIKDQNNYINNPELLIYKNNNDEIKIITNRSGTSDESCYFKIEDTLISCSWNSKLDYLAIEDDQENDIYISSEDEYKNLFTGIEKLPEFGEFYLEDLQVLYEYLKEYYW